MLSVSPEHPAVMLSLRQVQCQRLLLASDGTVLPDAALEQLNGAVAMNPTDISAWHVSVHQVRLQLHANLSNNLTFTIILFYYYSTLTVLNVFLSKKHQEGHITCYIFL